MRLSGWTLAIVIPLAILAASLLVSAGLGDSGASSPAKVVNPYGQWKNGPSSQPDYFPIAVWLQDPRMAGRYKAAGINLYVGLWKGPTEEQLAALKASGMPVICDQNAVGLKHKDDRTIAGWMHGDEPDNAQELPGGKGYGPPIEPKKIVADYERIAAADPTRPVMLNLGQGVAWDGYIGRGVRTNHPEDYAEYVKGCDIASFDIYPVAHDRKEIAGNLWYVAQGVDRLRQWSGGKHVVWNCIECTRISSDHKATPQQVKAEVWMSLIHGSAGLIYFVHEWKPKFNEHALLDDAEMLKAVTAINGRIHDLATVLNSPTIPDAAAVSSSNDKVPIDVMVKRDKGAIYLFAVAMRDGQTQATFSIRGLTGQNKVTVLGEERAIDCQAGRFADEFKPWDVHLYRIQADRPVERQ